MAHLLFTVIMCMKHAHDQRLMLIAAVVCAIGTYASFALAAHAVRLKKEGGREWALLSILAAGCTAWATHFIILLAFKPGMPAAFDPILTAVSLLGALAGLGVGILLGMRERRRSRRFAAGLIMGTGIAALHYVGQAAYLVQGTIAWNLWLVLPSIAVSLPMCGLAMLAAANRIRQWRYLAAPLLLAAIAVLHFCGMAAMTLHYDAGRALPDIAVLPATITPVVAGVSLGLLALAILGMRHDIAARTRLRWERKRLGELAGVALEGLLICEGEQVIAANASIERLTDRAAGSLSGAALGSLLPGLDITAIPEREEREAELTVSNGDAVPVRVLRSEVRIGRKRQTVVAVRDQRERLRTEATMRSLAYSDALTGLPNRRRFLDLLERQTSSRRSNDADFAVLLVDLDRFKHVNDTLGHPVGDLLLRKVADRIRSAVRDDDVVARLGGDEFAILQLGGGSPAMAGQLANRIIQEVGGCPFLLEGQPIYIGASIGIACAPADGNDAADLLRNADLALYAAKADGRGKCRRYDPELDEKSKERRVLEDGLRLALKRNELELHYQPLVDARSGRITSAEALVRWRHPERGLISPADFIPLAEETGLILPLGEWVIRAACQEAAGWDSDIAVAVNLSPAQFSDRGLAATIEAALAATGLSAGRLELEITEGVLLTDEKQTMDTLVRLKAQGLRISMDDFGTGYSSLSYLRRFPFDKIKIDQSFIRMAPHDAECASIVRAIITMGNCLGLMTTVEGVETQEQHDFSVAEGCNTIQGYHVSRPLPPREFAAFCRRWAVEEQLAA